jgi:hypothetical protein
LQVVILLAISMFTVPWLAPVMVPVMRALGGERVAPPLSPIHFNQSGRDLPAHLPPVGRVGGLCVLDVRACGSSSTAIAMGHSGTPPFRPCLVTRC